MIIVLLKIHKFFTIFEIINIKTNNNFKKKSEVEIKILEKK